MLWNLLLICWIFSLDWLAGSEGARGLAGHRAIVHDNIQNRNTRESSRTQTHILSPAGLPGAAQYHISTFSPQNAASQRAKKSETKDRLCLRVIQHIWPKWSGNSIYYTQEVKLSFMKSVWTYSSGSGQPPWCFAGLNQCVCVCVCAWNFYIT